MAQQQSTRIHPHSADPPASSSPREGLDLQTLVLSAIASAVAAYVTSKVWAAGTLWAAAMSPVIVALVKEGLRRPAEVMTSAVPSPRVLATRPATRREPLPDDLPDRLDVGAPPPFPPPAAGAPAGPVRVYSTRGRRLRWRLAVVTGLLGFAVCALVYTVPEVIAGRSVVSSGDKTTLWGGSRHRSKADNKPASTTTSASPAATTPAPKDEPAQTVTAPPQTVTVAPPTATAPPAATTPAQTTPAPAAAPDATATTPGG